LSWLRYNEALTSFENVLLLVFAVVGATVL